MANIFTLNNSRVIVKPTGSRDIKLEQTNTDTIPRKNDSEFVIYESKPGDFWSGYSRRRLKLINTLYENNSNRTTAQFYDANNELIEEKTSDNVVKVIGQENYDVLLSVVLSVFSLEFKVRGILALLTPRNNTCRTVIVKEQTIFNKDGKQVKSDTGKAFPILEVEPPTTTSEPEVKSLRGRRRQKQKTYVVTKATESSSKLNEIIITSVIGNTSKPENKTLMSNKKDIITENETAIAKIKTEHEIGNNNFDTALEEREAAEQHSTTNTESKRQELSPASIKMPDGSIIMVSVEPEDYFHIATPEILKNVTNEEQKKLVSYQLYIDWKYCLNRNEDDYLPLHLAVQYNDIDLLRRQCFMLTRHQESLDTLANNMTALQMSLAQPDPRAMSILLQYGADPLYCDEDQSTILHKASESNTPHLKVFLEHCRNNARQILQSNNMLWVPSMDTKSDSELADHLLDHMCESVDEQGCTPLMVASRMGISQNVSLLVEASPSTINRTMPNCGHTAVYIAVWAACLDAIHRGNKSTVSEEFSDTLKILIENGADTTIPNFSGADVSDLLSDYNMPELMKLVTSLVTSERIYKGTPLDVSKYMILKERDGTMTMTEIASPKTDYKRRNNKKVKNVKAKNDEPTNKSLKNVRIPKQKYSKLDSEHERNNSNLNTEPNEKVVIKTETVTKNRMFILGTNPTQNLDQIKTPSTSNIAKLPVKKPIIIKKKSSTVNPGIIISKLRNNIIYEIGNKGVNSNTGINTSVQPSVESVGLKRPITTTILPQQVKKKKDDNSST